MPGASILLGRLHGAGARGGRVLDRVLLQAGWPARPLASWLAGRLAKVSSQASQQVNSKNFDITDRNVPLP